MNRQLDALSLYPREDSPSTHYDKKLYGPQSQSEHQPGIEHQLPFRADRSLVAVPSELSRLSTYKIPPPPPRVGDGFVLREIHLCLLTSACTDMRVFLRGLVEPRNALFL